MLLSISKLLKNRKLATIIKKTAALQKLNSAVREVIDPALCEHFLVASTSGNTLTLNAKNPAWATRLRYLAPQLLDLMQSHELLKNFTQIAIKVDLTETPELIQTPMRPLSASNAKMITLTAAGIEDEKLKQALLKLAKHT